MSSFSHQLFKKPHPPKRVRSRLNGDNAGISVPPGCTSDKIFFHHLDNLRPSLTPVKGEVTGNRLAVQESGGLLSHPGLAITDLLFSPHAVCKKCCLVRCLFLFSSLLLACWVLRRKESKRFLLSAKIVKTLMYPVS